VAGAAHTGVPGLCPRETSHVGIDAGREGVYICLDPEPKWKFWPIRHRHKDQKVVMHLYPDREEIQEWIEWTRRNLPYEGDIPCLNWTGPEVKAAQSDDMPSEAKNAGTEEPPWSERITELLDGAARYENWEAPREVMLDVFVRTMMADLLDLAPRFTALHFYYSLATEEWPEWSLYNKDLYEAAQSAFRDDLRTLVGLLPIEQCPHDWRRLKWEISNAVAGRDWDRVGQIFKLTEAFHATEATHLWALRGRISFFRAFDKDGAQLPKMHSSLLTINPPVAELVGELNLLDLEVYQLSLVGGPKQILKGQLDQKMRETARDARNDLEKAIHSRETLGPPYHAMLGACHLALGDYAHAADEYNIVLNTETTFRAFMLWDFVDAVVRQHDHVDVNGLMKILCKSDPSSFKKDFKPDLLQVLAKCHLLAGKPDKAEAVYQRWASEYANDPQVHLHLAEFFAQEADYEKAYRALRKAVDLKPELEQELPYKVALPLGAIAAEYLDLDKITREAIKEHPEVEKLLDLLLRDVWSTYSKLRLESRQVWLFASIQTYYSPSIQPGLASQFRQAGAQEFAKAVEIELRHRVFEAFRTETSKDVNVRALAEQARTDLRAKLFAEFLLARGKLTLGQMAFILREGRAGKDKLFMLLGEWVNQHFPGLDDAQLVSLKKIYELRNLESHESKPLNVDEVPNLCRGFLDAFLQELAKKRC
jgi:tetratricopeptide (TPR) repeat protein